MITPPTPPPQGPLLTLAVLHRALWQQRLDAYRHPSDADDTDTLARYLWNMGLASALHLHERRAPAAAAVGALYLGVAPCHEGAGST